MLKRLAYGVCLPVVLAVVYGVAPAWAASPEAGQDSFSGIPWNAPEAATLAEWAGLSLTPAGHLSLRLKGYPDALAATTLPTGGHNWHGRKRGDAVSAELTYVLPAQGRMVPYVGLRVTHLATEGAEQRGVSIDSPAQSEYGVGARTGITLITGPRGQLHMGLALTVSDPDPTHPLSPASWGDETPNTTRLGLALLYSRSF